jgi:outer membrane protein assembly factor BamD
MSTVIAAGAAGACATHARNSVPPGTTQPDKFLFDRGTIELNNKKWLTAREFFKQVVETYTASPYRPDAKLGLADTYLGENTSESLVLALNEYTEFLSFYPTNKRADYAQYKVGMTHVKQMRAAQRDQTETRAAIKSFETFIDRYPSSSLMGEVKSRLRQTRDRLSEADYQVGFFYYRARWYPGAIDRFKTVLKADPEFTGRDAVYFFLGESLVKVKLNAEALPYFERLVAEFERSQYLQEARKLIASLKADAQVKTGGPTP